MNKQEEILNGQIGETLVTGQNEQLFQITDIPGTPFRMIEKEGKYFAVLGQYKVTNDENDPQIIQDMIEGYDYHFIINLMFAVCETIINNKSKEQ